MRRVVQTVTGVGTSSIVPVDPRSTSFGIGFGCEVTGTATFSVQHTFDDIFNPAITPVWFNHEFVNAQTANVDGNYAFPIAAFRLNVTAGTGTVTMVALFNAGQG
jgi:hypothetical protein